MAARYRLKDNPVYRRERMATRRADGVLLRICLLLLLGMLVGPVLARLWSAGQPHPTAYYDSHRMSERVFGYLYVAFAAIVGWVPPALVAITLTGEREKGTIEQLLLTPIERIRILWGIYAARLRPFALALAAAAPLVVLVPIIMPPPFRFSVHFMRAHPSDYFIPTYILLLAQLLFGAAAGIHYTATSRSTIVALVRTYSAILLGDFGMLVLFTKLAEGGGSWARQEEVRAGMMLGSGIMLAFFGILVPTAREDASSRPLPPPP